MITEYINENKEAAIHCSRPMPGITAYFCRVSEPAAECAAALAANHFEGLLCLAGRIQVQLAGSRVETVGMGELLLLTYQAQVEGISFDLVPAVFLAVDVDKQASRSCFGNQAPPPFDSVPDTVRLREVMDGCGGCLVLHDPDWSGATLAALRRLPPERHGAYFILRLMERLCVLSHERLPNLDGDQKGYCDAYQKAVVGRVHDYILENLDTPATIRQLAQKFQMSPTCLKENFRKIYGKPIHTYLQQYRLQRAAQLLCATDESVLVIAAQVGYSGTSRFNAAFKETYHVTPMEYRRLSREKMSKNGV